MSRNQKSFDAIVLILDMRSSSANSGFLNQAISCGTSLVEKKLFSESTDQFGIVLFGTRNSNNSLGYSNVSVWNDHELQSPSFEILKYLNEEIRYLSDEIDEGDWLDSIVVALDLIKRTTENKSKIKAKKIVLMSDLSSKINEDQLDVIVRGMESENVEFIFFGPDWNHEEEEEKNLPGPSNRPSSTPRAKPKTKIQEAGETMLKEIVERTDGIMCGIQDALINLTFKERKAKKPFPWNVTLEIGSDIKINVTGYIAVRREAPKSWKKCLAKSKPSSNNDSIELRPTAVYVKDDETRETVDPDNLIESYRYGSELVTVSNEDKANYGYNGGPKSLKVIGFIKLDKIPIHSLSGDGNMIFLSNSNDEHSEPAISALAYGMQELNRAALVRKVYRAGSTPRLGVLIPEKYVTDDEEESLRLIFIELPYQEDYRSYNFAPLYTEDRGPTDVQLEAVGNFIDASMMEDFESETISNPYVQYLYRCLTHRGLYPGKVLPALDGFIKETFSISDEIKKNNENILSELKKICPLKPVSMNEGKRKLNQPKDENDTLSKKSKEQEESSIITEFSKSIDMGEPLEPAANKLEESLRLLLRSQVPKEINGQLLRGLKAYRDACLLYSKPELYNQFLRAFKLLLSGNHHSDVWLEIAESNLGLITKFEHSKSTVITKVADDFITSFVN